MSISMATKGVIAQFAPAGGGYPVYTPMEEPTVDTEEIGSISIYGTGVTEPSISSRELKPKMKAE